MDLLWLALVVQIIYYIVNKAYVPVIVFIALSSILSYWKPSPLVFLAIPMLVAHLVFLRFKKKEPFIKKRHTQR